METRRGFIKKSSAALLALTLHPLGNSKLDAFESMDQKAWKPEKAAVVWYSQTGHTRRAGELIAQTLVDSGLKTIGGDYRNFNRKLLEKSDLIVTGSPVHYYDIPLNFKSWLGQIPNLKGRPVASWVTYGGEGGNQYNTSKNLAGILASKGGIPVAAAQFGNMSTFAMTWSVGNHERILKYRHTPDQNTYARVRQFADQVIERVRFPRAVELEKEFFFWDLIKGRPSIWGTKLMISRHGIDKTLCIECGTCIEKCPVSAIDLETGKIDRELCILCLGCINNCPVNSVEMLFLGRRVYGFNEFVRQNRIKIKDPGTGRENSFSEDI